MLLKLTCSAGVCTDIFLTTVVCKIFTLKERDRDNTNDELHHFIVILMMVQKI